MTKLFIVGFLALGSLYSCNSGPKNLDGFMVDISEFKINDSILKDGDYVEILGSSGNLGDYIIEGEIGETVQSSNPIKEN